MLLCANYPDLHWILGCCKKWQNFNKTRKWVMLPFLMSTCHNSVPNKTCFSVQLTSKWQPDPFSVKPDLKFAIPHTVDPQYFPKYIIIFKTPLISAQLVVISFDFFILVTKLGHYYCLCKFWWIFYRFSTLELTNNFQQHFPWTTIKSPVSLFLNALYFQVSLGKYRYSVPPRSLVTN